MRLASHKLWLIGLALCALTLLGTVRADDDNDDDYGSSESTSSSSSNTGSSSQTASGPGIATFCTPSKSFCLDSAINKQSNTITFTMSASNPQGWAGFGVGGSRMTDTTMYVFWMNANGQPVLSQRTARGNVQPQPVQQTGFTLGGNVVGANAGSSRMAVTFSRPLNDPTARAINQAGRTNFIWAVGGAPANRASAEGSFPEHSDYGNFNIDYSQVASGNGTGAVGSGGRSNTAELRLVHGIFMIIAWLIFPFIGIFIAKFMKDRMGHWWYILHKGIMFYGIGVAVIIGLILIELQVPPGGQRFVSTTHGILGTILCFVLFPIQVALGFVANAMWTPDRKSIPWWDQTHWWVGRLSALMGIVTIYLGLVVYKASVGFFVGVSAILVMGIASMIFGAVKYGTVHHVAKEGQATA
ncbi:hypothetical protein HDV05_001582 [Chytridiales sp. JEL 0842]|nr:hypothetical protein HDV05_001582 [Chytridiales sp. JEL 0842]